MSALVNFSIKDLNHLIRLWTITYNSGNKPDWSHLLPYYDDNIHFTDTVQEIHGIKEFSAMVNRLTKRSGQLSMKIVNAIQEDSLVFIEWEMTILFKKTRTSVIHGASRLLLNEKAKIIEQRDYYDLWGDIFDNIPGFNKAYRKFMRKVFG